LGHGGRNSRIRIKWWKVQKRHFGAAGDVKNDNKKHNALIIYNKEEAVGEGARARS